MKTSSAVTAGHRGLEDSRIYKLALTGLFAALSYVVFTFLQIKITLPGGDATSIHLGNAVCGDVHSCSKGSFHSSKA